MSDLFANLPNAAFWRPGVVDSGPFDLTGLIQPKFPLTRDMAIATAGSCFAQHVGRALRQAGLPVLDVEPAPPGLEGEAARAYGFGLYSGRYGNIYTARQMRQLLEDTRKLIIRPQAIWQRCTRFYDALRPGTEPDGCASASEVTALRQFHLTRLKQLFTECQLFIFTLGLTETWEDVATGTIFPSAPGVIADPPAGTDIRFCNLTYPDVLDDLSALRKLLHRFNPTMKLLLTVSPVPLTATASGRHVLLANTTSKAILRAAADAFSRAHPDVDYMPSYEIITHPAARGRFFSDNLRSVTPEGVDHVMANFLAAHGLTALPTPDRPDPGPEADEADILICEEALLEAFRP